MALKLNLPLHRRDKPYSLSSKPLQHPLPQSSTTSTTTKSSSSMLINTTTITPNNNKKLNNLNIADLLKSPICFFSPASGKMNNNSNSYNYHEDDNYYYDNSSSDSSDSDSNQIDNNQEGDHNNEEQPDIDLSILRVSLKNKNNNNKNIDGNSSSSSSDKYLINSNIGKSSGKNGNVFFVNNSSSSSSTGSSNSNNTLDTIFEKEKLEVSYDNINHDNRNTFAIKQQIISTPQNKQTQAYRELLILDHLKALVNSNKTCNFVQLVNWYKASPKVINYDIEFNDYDDDDDDDEGYDDDEDGIDNELDELNEIDSTTGIENDKQIIIYSKPKLISKFKSSDQYMHMILEYADLKSLYDLCKFKKNEFSIHQIKSLLFQIIYAIAISQKELEFNHNDLHFRNILLKSFPSDKKYIVYQDKLDNKSYSNWIVGGDWIVKISDFGLSRIKIPTSNEIIFNQRNQSTKEFCFYTDLSHVSNLLDIYKIKFTTPPTSSEQEYLEDLKNYKQLKKQMKQNAPYKLLELPFFNSLKICPQDCNQENSIRISTDGIIPLEFPTPPPTPTPTPTPTNNPQKKKKITSIKRLDDDYKKYQKRLLSNGKIIITTPKKTRSGYRF